MKILTAAEMREVDRLTIERGVPSLVLMENAACRVVEAMEREFAPLAAQRILIVCGKGNNGGDGLAIARQLLLRNPAEVPRGNSLGKVASLWVLLTARPAELSPDAAANLKMFELSGGHVESSILPEMRTATLLVDALLGTGLRGMPHEASQILIREMNQGFPLAQKVAVDIPSGMTSDDAGGDWEHVNADLTVTFTAPKPVHLLGSGIGKLLVGQIGSPAELLDRAQLNVSEAADFAEVLRSRKADANKGSFGHVLVIGGSPGKTGAAEMSGLAALRIGAGLVTVSSSGQLRTPELMTESPPSFERKTVAAVGPGLGQDPTVQREIRDWFGACPLPMVVDADGLNALAASNEWSPHAALRVLTPHPGEMSRLTGKAIPEVQADRLATARDFATDRDVVLVLKGHRTVIAFPDGSTWINPTGTPALATAGTGDILTGMIAGLLAQFPADPRLAVRAAVFLHGRCGELCAHPLIATDLLTKLPEAIREIRG
ncbi:MAG: NAD(P)H-hydrate dehydratase [Bryobacteraceae bacterium]